MKKRSGFVSNSSSSSFIVALQRGLSRQELREALFGDRKLHGAYEREYRVEDVMDVVYGDYSRQCGFHFFDDEERLVEEMCSGYYEGCPEVPMNAFMKMTTDEVRKAYEIYDAIDRETAARRLREFMFHKVFCESGDLFAFVFEYGDSSSFGSVLEHGGTFDNVPHLRISKH